MFNTRLSQAVNHPSIDGAFRFQINKGEIISVRNEFNAEFYSPNVFEVFIEWLDTQHPGAFDTIYRVEGNAAIALYTPEALDLMEGCLEEFEASRS